MRKERTDCRELSKFLEYRASFEPLGLTIHQRKLCMSKREQPVKQKFTALGNTDR